MEKHGKHKRPVKIQTEKKNKLFEVGESIIEFHKQ